MTVELPDIELRRIACKCFAQGTCWTVNMPYATPEQHFRTRPMAAVAGVRAKRSLQRLSQQRGETKMSDKYRNPSKQDDVDDPQWDHASKVHDWRNHVGSGVKAIWHTFTPEQRMALAADADERASAEHWE